MDDMIANLIRVWDDASERQMREGRQWYAESHNMAHSLSAEYGVTPEQAAGVLAAMSPNTSWRANVTLARAILSGAPRGLGNGLRMAARILNGEDVETVLTGARETYKILNFYRGILSDGTRGVTIDRHAYDAATGIRHADKPERATETMPLRPKAVGKIYRRFELAYANAAILLSMREGRHITACEVQAVVWVVWREYHWSETAFKVS